MGIDSKFTLTDQAGALPCSVSQGARKALDGRVRLQEMDSFPITESALADSSTTDAIASTLGHDMSNTNTDTNTTLTTDEATTKEAILVMRAATRVHGRKAEIGRTLAELAVSKQFERVCSILNDVRATHIKDLDKLKRAYDKATEACGDQLTQVTLDREYGEDCKACKGGFQTVRDSINKVDPKLKITIGQRNGLYNAGAVKVKDDRMVSGESVDSGNSANAETTPQQTGTPFAFAVATMARADKLGLSATEIALALLAMDDVDMDLIADEVSKMRRKPRKATGKASKKNAA